MAQKITTPDRVLLLLSMISYLREREFASVNELAQEFGVAPKLIRELARFLGTAGVPGETLTYQHEDLFDIDWDALEQRDEVRLVQLVAVDDTPRFTSTETAALIAGLQSLTLMLPADLVESARTAAEKLAAVANETQPASVLSVSEDPVAKGLSLIARALEKAHTVSFTYRDAMGRQTERTVDPLFLSESGGQWYLRGFCHDRQAERTFLVDRIRDISLGAESRSAPRTQPVERVTAADEARAVRASIRARVTAIHRLQGFEPVVLGEAEPGWIRAEVELRYAQAAVRLVQAAPGQVIIDGPASARESVMQWSERALAQYDV